MLRGRILCEVFRDLDQDAWFLERVYDWTRWTLLSPAGRTWSDSWSGRSGDLVARVRAMGRRPERLAAMREEPERMHAQVRARRRNS